MRAIRQPQTLRDAFERTRRDQRLQPLARRRAGPVRALLVVLLGCSAAAGGELAQHYGFGEFEIYKLKPRIGQLHLADLNGDGRTDIALWNDWQSRIEIFYQPGPRTPPPTGARGAPERNDVADRGRLVNVSVPLAYKISAFQVADLTGDGHADLVAFAESRELLIVPGKGDGEFGPASALRAPEVEPRAVGLAVGDFNSDGRSDAALLGSDSVLVFLQKPEGGLGKALRYFHGIKQPLMLFAADLDGDGRTDLLITADEDQYGCYAYLQEADGVFGALRRVRVPRLRSMTIAPSEEDRPGCELLAVQHATSRLNIYRWGHSEEQLAGAEWPQRLYSYPSKSTSKRRPIAVGDLTGDGLPDIVAGDPDGAQFVLFRGLAEGGVAAGVAYPGLARTLDLQIADVDGDGRAELLSVSAEEKMIGVSRFEEGRLSFPAPLPVRGTPLAVGAGRRLAGTSGPPEWLAYVTRIEKQLTLIVRNLPDGAEQDWPIEKVEEDPAGVRFADVDQDGRNDLLIFIRFSPLRAFLQTAEGGFAALPDEAARGALVKEAAPEGFDLADVTGDGRPELLLAQKTFARALIIRDGRWTVVDQFNPETADAQITGLAVLPGEPGSPLVALYDRRARELLTLARRPDHSYAVAQTLPLANFDLNAMTTMTSRNSPAQLLLADAEKLTLVEPAGRLLTLLEQATYETDVKDGWLADAVVGDVNGDGVRDVIVVDLGKAALEILARRPSGDLVRAQRFQVFQGKRFSEGPDVRGEPREVLCGDVTGDGIDDIVLIAHDRLLIYPGQ